MYVRQYSMLFYVNVQLQFKETWVSNKLSVILAL